ncbi:hypothetical protein LSAT2_014417 [Lamellibrachia satsuma]|nr:hypothetical protein LSAT2_014417 [Lamellibrachia satsuma]
MHRHVIDVIRLAPADRDRHQVHVFVPWLKSKSNLLNELDPDVLTNLVCNCDYKKSTTDEVLIKQGDKGECLYIILEGSVSVFIDENITNDEMSGGRSTPPPRYDRLVVRHPSAKRHASINNQSGNQLEVSLERPMPDSHTSGATSRSQRGGSAARQGSACQKTGDREEKEEVKKSAKPVREKNVEKFAKEYKFVVTLGSRLFYLHPALLPPSASPTSTRPPTPPASPTSTCLSYIHLPLLHPPFSPTSTPLSCLHLPLLPPPTSPTSSCLSYIHPSLLPPLPSPASTCLSYLHLPLLPPPASPASTRLSYLHLALISPSGSPTSTCLSYVYPALLSPPGSPTSICLSYIHPPLLHPLASPASTCLFYLHLPLLPSPAPPTSTQLCYLHPALIYPPASPASTHLSYLHLPLLPPLGSPTCT